MPTKKKPKPAVCTRYAVQMKGTESYLGTRLLWDTFDHACLFAERPARSVCGYGTVVVPVRCRALTSKAKNAKRTR